MKKVLILALLLICTALTCYAAEKKTGWDKVTRGWSRMPIRIYLDETGDYTSMIKSGFSDWESKSGRKVRFTYITKVHSGYANITVRIVDKFTDQTAGRTSANIGVNNIFKSKIDIGIHSQNGRKFSQEELDIIIRHEIGHALGLGHDEDKKSIMYPYVLRGQSITKSDIEKLLELY